MKRIAIFCDGTWNNSDAGHATNVLKLAQAVVPVAPDGSHQQVFYYPGVGSGRGSSWLARQIDRYGGGAFGWGLTENMQDAFRSLIFCFEPGDEIFIFGFSRGAYTARSLAGLIRKAGIPARDQVPALPEAIRQYRARGDANAPDTEAQMRFRAHISPGIATSGKEMTWRRANGYKPARLLRIRYLGVWDTVGGLGLPGMLGLLARLWNRKYRFHDMVLSRSVAAARHALALDERRRLYPYTPWDNMERLNARAAQEIGVNRLDGAERLYQQLWFPGNHSIVGGSGPVPPLSAITLRWIAAGAQAQGLVLDEDMLDDILDFADPAAETVPLTQAPGPGNLMGALLADRDLAPTSGEMHKSVAARQAALGYRPAARFR